MRKMRAHLLLPKILTFYLLAALFWWSYLLFRKNKLITTTQLELLQLESNVKFNTNNYNIKSLDEYDLIINKHRRQQYMIIGESLVFAITLIIGIGLINRAHLRQLENQNRQNNFLLSVTHELRSPLASIMLILDTFKKRKLSQDKIEELVADAVSEGARLDKQINNMLLATKLDRAYQINKQELNIIPIISQLKSSLLRQYPESTIDIQAESQEIKIFVDKEGFMSIVGNIMENALKYSYKDNRVVELAVKHDLEYLVIEVKDQGIGISDSQKEKVIEQFYRIGNENTRNSKGTGLGLFIVDKLVKIHNGSISIKDNEPKGTIFTIKLPKK